MNDKPSFAQHPGYADLDDREKEVLQLLSEGKTPKAIAFVITSSERTVDIHIKSILDKLGLEDRKELAEFLKQG